MFLSDEEILIHIEYSLDVPYESYGMIDNTVVESGQIQAVLQMFVFCIRIEPKILVTFVKYVFQ